MGWAFATVDFIGGPSLGFSPTSLSGPDLLARGARGPTSFAIWRSRGDIFSPPAISSIAGELKYLRLSE